MPSETPVSSTFDKDCQWFNENYNALQKEFAGKAIAIIDKKIYHSDSNYLKFLKWLRNKGIDPAEICIEVFPEEDAAYIL